MLTFCNIIIAALYLTLTAGYVVLLHKENNILKRFLKALLTLTVLAHLLLLIIGAVKGDIALSTVCEALSALAGFTAVILLFLELRSVRGSLGAFIVPFVFIIQMISVLCSRLPSFDEGITRMPLFIFHTITTIIGYTFFIYSFILGLMHLNLLGRINRKKFDNLFFELPSLKILERLNIIALLAGFVLLSFGLVTGFRLAYILWNTIPFSDPKIILSLVLWIIYLLSFIAIGIFRLKGRMMSYWSIAGFILIMVIFMIESFSNATMHKF